MKKRLNVIWIDDEYDKQANVIDEAEHDDFQFIPFKTSREGMEYLCENLHDVDALVLDAKVFKETTNETASTKGLCASLAEISKISGQNGRKEIPCVIFTGQADLLDNESFLNMIDGIPVCSKNTSNKILFEKLRELIGESESATIRNRYPLAYSACEWMAGNSWRLLYPILNSMGSGVGLGTDQYNDLRKVLELGFRKLHEAGIIHERLIENGHVNIWGSSAFLGGYPAKYGNEGLVVTAKSAVIPKLVGEQVKFVLNVCQVGSHTESNQEIPVTKPSITEVEKRNKNHHLLEISTLMTLDFIVWAKSYVEANPDVRQNMENWEPMFKSECEANLMEASGIVLKPDSYGNYYVRMDDGMITNKESVRIRKNLIPKEGLKINARVTVKFKCTDVNKWEAVSYGLL